MRKIMVAIPAYLHSVHCDTMLALMHEQLHALSKNWMLEVVPVCGHSMLPYARNLLAGVFLERDFTDLVFIDSDTSWKAPNLCDTLAKMRDGYDIIGGAVPVRMEPIQYRVRWREDIPVLQATPEGLLEVEALGTAFLCIRRKVLEELKSDELEYFEADLDMKKTWEFFKFEKRAANDLEKEQGIKARVWGEDMGFCDLARSKGFKIWMNPEISFKHAGKKDYTGCIGEWLRNR